MKKLLASCAALALAATSMLPMTAAADAAADYDGKITLEASTDSSTIKAGDTVKYELKIKENSGVNGWSVLVEFDTDKLTYEKVTSKKIIEEVPGYDGITTETKIVSPVPKDNQEGNSFPIVWAEGTKTYAEIFEENEKDVPAEVDGKNYIYTGINKGNPVAEIVFTAKSDIAVADLEGLVNVSGTKAVKNDPEDPAGKFDVEIEVDNTFVKKEPSISLDRTTATLKVDQTGTLKATTENTTGTVTWTSSDDTVATVDANGTVTGVAEGTATITASVDGVSASCVVTVTDDEKPIEINLPDQNIEVEDTLEFDVKTVIPEITAAQVAAIPVTVDDDSIVSYKTDGTKIVFTGLKAGTATVTVTSPSTKYILNPFKITVVDEIVPIPVLPDQTVTEGLSTNYDISNAILATILPNLEVESLDPSIATVEFSADKKNLIITGIKAGTVVAQVKDKTTGTVIGKFNITVEAAGDPENEFVADFRVKIIDLKLGGTNKLAIVVDPEDDDTLPFTDITKWTLKSSDDTIVSVDPDGTIVGLRSGEVTITATNPDYNGTLTATVTVKTVFPVYVPTSPVNPGDTANVKPGDNTVARAKVTPYVNAIVDSESKAASVIAATGGEMDSETGNAPAIAAAALGLIALGFVVVARKKRHA
ncbi:MAG: Ig-like domain-containing protein [Ruminococcus sp.]|nr:Ig-like domain-containing protein [Ruminococcus sp.]